MKILQATTAIGWSGGTEQCLLLAKYMNQAGYNADILTFQGCELEEKCKKNNIHALYFPNTKKFSIKEAKKLSQLIEQYDVVNTHISRAHWFIWFASFFCQKRPKIVFTRRVPYNISFLSLLTKYNFHTDAIIAVSREIEKNLKKFPIAKKIHYIPSGVELERFKPDIKSTVKKELQIDDKTLVLTNVGNFSTVKGQHILIPTFKKLLEIENGKKFVLLLVGRDTESESSKKLIESYGILDKVKLLGFRNDIPEILKITDLFVFPSLEEGIAGSLLQAMAMEKIVVASYVGGIKNYLKNMVNGIAIKPGDVDSLLQGILTGLKNIDNVKMKKEARKTAKEFDIKKITEKTLKVYKELLQ